MFVSLFDFLKEQGFECRIFCLKKPDGGLTDSSGQAADSGKTSILSIFRSLEDDILKEKPDLIISFMDQTNIISLLTLLKIWFFKNLRFPILVCERNNPGRNLILNRRLPAFAQTAARLLRNYIYRFADYICVQSEGSKKYFADLNLHDKTYVIPNFVACPGPATLRNREQLANREKLVLAVARLVPEKGVQQLIQAFSQLGPGASDWKLVVYGDGPQKEQLTSEIKDLKLSDKVYLMGKTEDLSQIYSRASIFVLNSSFEGFPNALMEAMAYGCAVVATDCDFGPRDLIRNNQNGILIPTGDKQELINQLSVLISEPNSRMRLGQQAAMDMQANFSRDNFNDKFLALVSLCGN